MFKPHSLGRALPLTSICTGVLLTGVLVLDGHVSQSMGVPSAARKCTNNADCGMANCSLPLQLTYSMRLDSRLPCFCSGAYKTTPVASFSIFNAVIASQGYHGLGRRTERSDERITILIVPAVLNMYHNHGSLRMMCLQRDNTATATCRKATEALVGIKIANTGHITVLVLYKI